MKNHSDSTQDNLMCIFQILDILINNIFVVNIGRVFQQSVCISMDTYQGRIQDFKFKGAYLNKLRRAEGSAKMSGIFRVKNHDFMPKNLIFFNFRGGVHQCASSGSTPSYTNFYLPPNVKYTETTMWSVSTV